MDVTNCPSPAREDGMDDRARASEAVRQNPRRRTSRANFMTVRLSALKEKVQSEIRVMLRF